MRKFVRNRKKQYLCRQIPINMPARFTLENRTNKYGESPIRLSWSFGGQRFQTTLGISVKKTDWDVENKLVKPNTQNHNGQSADDINFFIKRINLVVAGIEQHYVGNEKALTKDMIKRAISEALSKDIARPEDILERCVNGIISVAEPETRYYRDLANRYYRFLCDAKNKYNKSEDFYILQELFGRRERVAVPTSRFKSIREKGEMYETLYYTEVSRKEVFGM